jgi:hypothetical protein
MVSPQLTKITPVFSRAFSVIRLTMKVTLGQGLPACLATMAAAVVAAAAPEEAFGPLAAAVAAVAAAAHPRQVVAREAAVINNYLP